jgi:tetratricopeptide (TPR) repeat protein
MGKKLAFLAILISCILYDCVGQTKFLDSLNLRLQSTIDDTTRFNFLESYIKSARVDFSDSAISKANEAIRLAEKIKDQTRRARALTLLGTAYYYHVNYAMAEKTHREAIALCEKEKITSELANALGSLALTLQTELKFQEAFETYFRVLKMEEASNNTQGVVKTLANLAILYRNLGDYDNALKNATIAYKILVSQPID